MKISIILLSALFIPAPANPTTIYVPDDYPTIQEAIDAAVNGDAVMVRPGTYVENIDFLGKAITVTSEQGPDLTIIDGNEIDSVVTFNSGEWLSSIIDGFTIQNGNAVEGGGIYCSTSSPTITNNRILDNYARDGGGIICIEYSNSIIVGNAIHSNIATEHGGGIWVHKNSCPIIEKNLIMENTAALIGEHGGQGGGIGCHLSRPIISNNRIIHNAAVVTKPGLPDVGGGGIALDGLSHAFIINNTIDGNYTVYGYGGGIFVDWDSSPIIKNNIITNSPDGEGIWVHGHHAFPTVDYNDFWNNSDGDYGGAVTPGLHDISENPCFVGPLDNDFHLAWTSPCRDAGDNSVVVDPGDFEGDPRIANGTVDMGADEFHTHLYYTGAPAPGGYMKLRVIDEPDTEPVVIWCSMEVLDPPFPTPHGAWYLAPPIIAQAYFTSIPPSGFLDWPHRFGPGCPSPLDLPLQGLVGNQLTNLCVLKIR